MRLEIRCISLIITIIFLQCPTLKMAIPNYTLQRISISSSIRSFQSFSLNIYSMLGGLKSEGISILMGTNHMAVKRHWPVKQVCKGAETSNMPAQLKQWFKHPFSEVMRLQEKCLKSMLLKHGFIRLQPLMQKNYGVYYFEIKQWQAKIQNEQLNGNSDGSGGQRSKVNEQAIFENMMSIVHKRALEYANIYDYGEAIGCIVQSKGKHKFNWSQEVSHKDRDQSIIEPKPKMYDDKLANYLYIEKLKRFGRDQNQNQLQPLDISEYHKEGYGVVITKGTYHRFHLPMKEDKANIVKRYARDKYLKDLCDDGIILPSFKAHLES